MIEMTELHIQMPVWITLTFIQGHKIIRKLKLLIASCNF